MFGRMPPQISLKNESFRGILHRLSYCFSRDARIPSSGSGITTAGKSAQLGAGMMPPAPAAAEVPAMPPLPAPPPPPVPAVAGLVGSGLPDGEPQAATASASAAKP